MIGPRIRELRKMKGANVTNFAEIIGISQGSLSDIENGKTNPSADTLASIVRKTDIDAGWLLTGVGTPPGNPRVKRLAEIAERLDDDLIDNLVREAEKEELLMDLKKLRVRNLGEVGIISLNLMMIMTLPTLVLLAAVGLNAVGGPMALRVLSWMPVICWIIILYVYFFPVQTLRILKHRYVSIVGFASSRIGHW